MLTFLAWIVCVILGAVVGFFAGYIVWRLGFELLGSALALVGAGAGGIIAFFGFLSLQDRWEEWRLGQKSRS
jgi:uncharacterized membrane protein YeaQ/YmgE (transglycosylase-associated protein family)